MLTIVMLIVFINVSIRGARTPLAEKSGQKSRRRVVLQLFAQAKQYIYIYIHIVLLCKYPRRSHSSRWPWPRPSQARKQTMCYHILINIYIYIYNYIYIYKLQYVIYIYKVYISVHTYIYHIFIHTLLIMIIHRLIHIHMLAEINLTLQCIAISCGLFGFLYVCSQLFP